MSATQLLIKNLSELLSSSTILTGGQKGGPAQIDKSSILLYSMVLILISILIKGYIIYLIYNFLVPKLIYSLSSSTNTRSLETIENNFKTLSFGECILLVIFFNVLFSF
jgi:hypothetical protein